MSESKQRKSREQKFLADHPDCYLCGGVRKATTIDHVPPKACFPKRLIPDGFWSPACAECNKGASKEDQIFGLYSMLLDFDETKMGEVGRHKRIEQLKQGIINNYPDALPDQTTARPVNRVGSIITPYPVAIEVNTNPAFKEALKVMGQKLTHALYMRETGKILSTSHRFSSHCYQLQHGGTETLTSYFKSILPKRILGDRPNVRPYGDYFMYLCGYKEKEDFFVYAAQFGHGLILWGIVLGPDMNLPDGEPLRSATWHRGACGSGASAGCPTSRF